MTKVEQIKKEAVSELGRPILRPVGIIQGIFLLAVISSPFILIWGTWDLTWKIGLTGFVGTLAMYFISEMVTHAITRAVDEGLERLKEERPKNKFMDRVEKLRKEREELKIKV